MGKIKVYELAKELNVQSKDIVNYLQDNGIDGKVAQSSLEDDAVAMIQKKFGAKSASAEQPKQSAAEKAAPAEQPKEVSAASKESADVKGESADAPKKKKRIVIVGNPQHSKTGMGVPQQKQQQKPQQKPQQQERPQQRQKPQQETAAKSDISAEQVAAKFKAILGDNKTVKQPTNSTAAAANNNANAGAESTADKAAANTASGTVSSVASITANAPTVNIVSRGNVIPKTAKNDSRNEASNEGNRQNNASGERRADNNDRRNDNRDNRGEGRQGGYNNDRRNDNRDNRGEGRQGGYNNDRRNDNRNDNRQGGFGGRPVFDKDKDEVQTRPGQGGKKQSGSRNSGSGFADVAPAKDNKRDERRASGQEKDRKNKKDYIYEEENTNIKGKSNNKAGKFIKPEKKVEVVEEQIKVIQLPETINIKDLAEKMKMQPSAIIKKLFMQGKIVTVNHELSYEEAEEIAMEYEILCEKEEKVDVIEELLKEEEEGEEVLVKRPPVICVMGHVDHGKTSLLDAIRKTHVTDKEAGGITQHIGAYTVKVPSGERITFLDTPGHEAFTAMRMRGANSTDIAILVVAADDGVMPQTVEAINHAKAAGIEIIVAVNKIDKPAANVERVKQELTEYGLVAEDWGGSTVFCPVSAKKGDGIEDLLEMILLTADVLELKANPKRQARGLVIEAQLDKGRGPVATVLVQKGTLHVGDFISAGACYGKVRAMIDDKGRRVKEAGPSTPVEILGLSDVPEAGEVFLAHESDKTAKTYAETYMAEYKARMLEETKKRMSLDDLFGQIQAGNLKELNVIVKADVQGSVEAVKQSLTKLSNEEVVVKCIHGGVGLINESDVVLASASNAIIIGFNSRPDATAKATAEREGVEIKLYRVIYQAIEDIERAMKGMLDPIYEEKVIGHAEVRQIFKASAVGNIAGSYVLDGVFQRGCKVRITREGKQIFEGELASLKRFKDDVKEVKAGYECGLVFASFDQMQELDIVEAYTMVEVPR